MEYLKLNNGIEIPKIMLGSFQLKNRSDMFSVVETAVSNNVFGFDTSPSYGTETLLAEAVLKSLDKHPEIKRENFFIGSKIDSWMMINNKGDVRKYIKKILDTTKLEYFDYILIHWPEPIYLVNTWKCLESVYKDGLVKSIGVCNFKIRHFNTLEAGGATMLPMITQNEIHPFNIDKEIVSFCKDNGIVVQAYSPLCRMLPEIKNNAMLNIMAEKYSISVPHLILKWHIQRGLVPVVKTSSPNRVIENTNVFNIDITPEDMELINSLDRKFKIFLESRCCPGY